MTRPTRDSLRDSALGSAVTWPGLKAHQVEQNRASHGANVLTPPKRTPWWKQFLSKFDDPVIRILMIAAAIAIAVGIVDGSYVEGIGIICAILLATLLAFLNEFRAAREFDILNKTSDEASVTVIREGTFMTIPRKDVVFGDVVVLEMGDEVPADGKILESVSLQIDESKLTGESVPVDKKVLLAEEEDEEEAQESAYPADQVFRGTTVFDGHGIVKVTAVGDSTEIGKTARAAAEEHHDETPLNRQLDRLSKLIGVVAFLVGGMLFVALAVWGAVKGEVRLLPAQWLFLGIVAASFLVAIIPVWAPVGYDALELLGLSPSRPGWIENQSIFTWILTVLLGAAVGAAAIIAAYMSNAISHDPVHWFPKSVSKEYLKYFMVAVTIIVVAVPEGLAMSVTLSLAYSMRRMTATNNLVRRMHACETIGATTVICSDKTGTLTLNEMRVHTVLFSCLQDRPFSKNPANLTMGERIIAEGVAANSTANLSRRPKAPPQPLGNPTESALLLWLDDHAMDYTPIRESFGVRDQLTFSSEKKYMATLGISPWMKNLVLHVKGSPEVLLERSGRILTADGIEQMDQQRIKIEESLLQLQNRGMRTLAFAYKEVEEEDVEEDLDKVTHDLVWLGFAAISDPVRPDVTEAVDVCRRAGIDVKVVTGDNPLTAKEIARQIGLFDPNAPGHPHMTGHEFMELDEDEAMERIAELRVLSRARPADKLRLVRLLKNRKEVVAVTGDGTNDGPALNLADVGLAMGKKGTAVAKEASDIILLDDSFKSIVNAVKWGRSLYQNIQRFIVFQLTINVTALGIALLGPFIGIKLPLTVAQMLWVNLIMDTFAALALATEPAHEEVLNKPPRDPSQFILTRPMIISILCVGAVFLASLVIILLYIQQEGVTRYEMSVFFTTFVMIQFWNLFNARCLMRTGSAFRGILENKAFLLIASGILMGQILIVELGGTVFRTVPLALVDWLLIGGATSVVLWAGELWRYIVRMKEEREQKGHGQTAPLSP